MTPQERDLVIRTMIAEAGNQGPAGMLAVANVIENRRRTGRWGKGYGDVVMAKSQFEPWMDHVRGTANDPRRIAASDPRYQQAAELLDAARAGVVPDVTGGMTHFYAPKAQAALGRNAPAWAKGPSKTIGDHVFFAPEGPAPNADPSAWDSMSRSSNPTNIAAPAPVQAPRPSTPFSFGQGQGQGSAPTGNLMGRMMGGNASGPMQSWADVFAGAGRDNPLLFRALSYAMQPNQPSPSSPVGVTAANASAGNGGAPPSPQPSPGAGNNSPMQLPGAAPAQPQAANPFGAMGDKLAGSPFGMLMSSLMKAI